MKSTIIKAGLMLALCSGVQNAVAQIETDPLRAVKYNPNPNYTAYSIGNGWLKVRDYQLSPVTFSDVSLTLDMQSTKYKKWGYEELEAGIQVGTCEKPADLLVAGANISYSLNALVYNHNNRLFLYAGGAVELNGYLAANFKSQGYNANSFNVRTSINPAINAKYRFRLWDQGFDLSQYISVPLIGVGWMPYYSSVMEGTMNNPKTLHATMLHPGNYFGLKSITNIDWRITHNGEESKSFFRLGYHFNGFRVKAPSELQFGNAAITIGYVRKF